MVENLLRLVSSSARSVLPSILVPFPRDGGVDVPKVGSTWALLQRAAGGCRPVVLELWERCPLCLGKVQGGSVFLSKKQRLAQSVV